MANWTQSTPAGRHGIWLPLLVLAALLAAIWVRFSPWLPSTLYGDDLFYFAEFLKGGCATKPSEILTTICQERFRPVASGFIIAEMSLFGTHVQPYIWVNSLVMALTSLIVFQTCMVLTKGRYMVSFFLAAAFATSRFALYHFTQVLGPVEGVTLLFCVLAVYCYARIDDGRGRPHRWATLAILAAGVAAFSHERTLVVSAWLIPALLLSPTLRNGARRRLALLLLACAAVPIVYVSYKEFALDTSFMIGTGGTHIQLDYAIIRLHASQAFMSLFGFNSGPDYLAAASVTPQWPSAFGSAAVFACCWLLLFALGLTSSLRSSSGFVARLDAVRWPIVILGFVVATLAPTLLTIRMEHRWLLIPFSAFILMPAWAAGVVQGRWRWVSASLVVLLSFSLAALDFLISRHFGNVFFVNSMNYADALHKELDVIARDDADSVALLAGREHCNWTLGNGMFFEVYGERPKSLHCFATLEEEGVAKLPAGTRVYGVDPEGDVVDLTAESEAARLATASTRVDFIALFPAGTISDRMPVSSPNGQGAFVMPWNSSTGTKNTLTVISGFQYMYRNVPVPAGDASLAFSMAMTYPSPTRARGTVVVTGSKGQTETFRRELTPPGEDATPSFATQSVPLATFAGQTVSVSFGVDSPHGQPNGHWIAYASPRIVVKEP